MSVKTVAVLFLIQSVKTVAVLFSIQSEKTEWFKGSMSETFACELIKIQASGFSVDSGK